MRLRDFLTTLHSGIFSRSHIRIFLCACTLGIAPELRAAILTWDNTPGTIGAGDGVVSGGAGTWNTTNGNWTSDGGVNNVSWPISGTDNEAIFGGTAGAIALDAGGVTANKLTFNISGYSLVTGPLTLNGTTPTITVGTGTATISSVISGSTGLTKTGDGTLMMNGTNSYTGGTTISQGTVISANAFGLGTSPLTLGDGSTGSSNLKLQFNVTGQIVASATVANTGSSGTATIVVNAANANLTSLVLNRSILLAGVGATANNQVLYSAISGPGAGAGNDSVIVDSGAGNALTMYVNNAASKNTYTGNLRVKSGTLQVGSLTFNGNTAGNQNLNIPDTASVTVDSGALLRFVWTGTETIDALNGAGTLDRNTGDGQGNVMLVLGANNGSGTFSGAITSQFSITKTGTGTQTFSGANTYAGTTTIKNGTLALGGGNDRLPTGTTVTIGDSSTNDSGILKLNGSSQTLAGLVMAGTGTVNKVVNGNATASVLTINNSTANVFAGVLGGTGTDENKFSMIKSGAGTLTLNSPNTFTGATNALDATGLRISGGIVSTNLVALNNLPSGIGGGSASLGFSGGTFQYTGSGGTIERRIELGTTAGSAIDASGAGALTWLNTGGFGGAGVSGARILTLTGTSTALNTMGVLLQNPGNPANTLALAKAGSGTWVLSAANTYTGTTTVNGGTLAVTGSMASNGPASVLVAAPDSSLANNPIITRRVGSGASYTLGSATGLGSTAVSTDPNVLNASMNTTASILNGTASGQTDVSMQWRARTASEALPSNPNAVLSNVLDLSGINDVGPLGDGILDTFVLQMSYTDAALGSLDENSIASSGELRLGWLDGATWKSAFIGNNNGTGTGTFVGTVAYNPSDSAHNVLGAYGVDPTNNVVWAVLNHNSEFAVIPEPGTWGMIICGGVIMLGLRRKKATI